MKLKLVFFSSERLALSSRRKLERLPESQLTSPQAGASTHEDCLAALALACVSHASQLRPSDSTPALPSASRRRNFLVQRAGECLQRS